MRPAAQAGPGPKSMCGAEDRELSYEGRVMRLRARLDSEDNSCSGFMISKTCGLSAGHCRDSLKFAEFNVPHGTDLTQVDSRDLFRIDPHSIQSHNGDKGNDYAVFRVLPHAKDERLAGESYGHFDISSSGPKKGDEVQVIGFGVSYTHPDTYLSQKSSFGPVDRIFTRLSLPFLPDKSYLNYDAGTSGGDSGAVVLDARTGQAVGIHTNGACVFGSRLNSATYILAHKGLQRAIKRCLDAEKK